MWNVISTQPHPSAVCPDIHQPRHSSQQRQRGSEVASLEVQLAGSDMGEIVVQSTVQPELEPLVVYRYGPWLGSCRNRTIARNRLLRSVCIYRERERKEAEIRPADRGSLTPCVCACVRVSARVYTDGHSTDQQQIATATATATAEP